MFTPEDAFVAAANTCIMMMFIWAAERFKLNLLSYECRAEGTKLIELDRTEIFTHLRFWPVIRVAAGEETRQVIEARAGAPCNPPRNTAWWPTRSNPRSSSSQRSRSMRMLSL